MAASDRDLAINAEICRALVALKAPAPLVAIVNSRYDTLGDAEILSLLRDWNARFAVAATQFPN